MPEGILNHPDLLTEGYGDLKPFFQPIVEVSSGKVTGYEALARFVRSDGTAVSAGYLFTDSRISIEDKRRLDRSVREQAIQKVHQLPEHTRMTLNISPQWLSVSSSESLPTLDLLLKYGVDPRRVVVELVEMNGDLSCISQAVAKYRKAGIRIAIDDFGAGFSQFDRVIALEPDIIKLDMRLFQQGAQGGVAEYVVESLATLCTKSGAVIVCEGVETEEEFYFALRCGAHHMQGFLFSPATEEFVDREAFSHQVAVLRARFFEQQKEQFCKTRKQYQDLYRTVELISSQHKIVDQLDIEFVSTTLSHLDGIIRFYAAHPTGEQFTANYDYSKTTGVWIKGDRFKGYNWSWRPYFYQLFAGESTVLSPRYLDIDTTKPCKTLSLQITESIILMVDIEVY